MKISASWTLAGNIRVALTLEPGELHPKLLTPIEVEEWLRRLLESFNARVKAAK